jgi:hypothetical protein
MTLIERGKDWIETQITKFRPVLCGNDTIRVAADGDVSGLALAILSVFGQTAPPLAYAAVLIARLGVKRLCEETWSPCHDR